MKNTIDEVIKCINTKVSFAGGGVIGAFFISIFYYLLGKMGSIIVISVLMLIGVILVSDLSISDAISKIREKLKRKKESSNEEDDEYENEDTGVMSFENTWFVPNPSEYFKLLDNSHIEVEPGIYKISSSCYITGVDADHGIEVYLMDDTGAAIKDFDYKLEQGTLSQMNYSRVVLFRFEKTTVLSVSVVLIGDKGTSNVKVSDTNLVLEKIHE